MKTPPSYTWLESYGSWLFNHIAQNTDHLTCHPSEFRGRSWTDFLDDLRLCRIIYKISIVLKKSYHGLHIVNSCSKAEKAIVGSALSVLKNRNIDPPSHFWSSGHGPGLVIFLYCQGPCLSPRRHGILQGISIAHERPCCHSN